MEHRHRRSRRTGSSHAHRATVVASLVPARSDRLLFAGVLLTLIPALFLAGSAWPRHIGDLVMEICAVPLILMLALAAGGSPDRSFRGIFERVFPWLLPLVLVLQIVPLPPAIWEMMPSHAVTTTVDDLTGTAHVFMPSSMTPAGTVAALAFLLPPLAVHLAIRSLGAQARLAVVLVVIVAAVVIVFVAMAQALFGPQSIWNFYGTATSLSSTGLFNSRNHFPALLYMTVPFVFAGVRSVRTHGRGRALAIYAIATVAVGILLLGTLLSRSRGGMTGAFLALALAAIAFAHASRGRAGISIPKWIVIVPVAMILWLLDREFGQIQARLGENIADDYRSTVFATTWRAIVANWPWGTGFGSFVDVYQKYETPETVIYSFVNFAHNDYFQILLEGGLLGGLLLAAFVVWFLARMAGLLFASRGEVGSDPLVIAAAISCSVLLLHSIVEYPLRTGSIACVFAIATGLLVHPARRPDQASSEEKAGSVSTSLGGREDS